MTHIASCQCGQLSIALEGQPRGVGLCHCYACQRRTGSVFAALAGFRGAYKVSGEATEYVRAGDQGAQFRFRFCPTCGTNRWPSELTDCPIGNSGNAQVTPRAPAAATDPKLATNPLARRAAQPLDHVPHRPPVRGHDEQYGLSRKLPRRTAFPITEGSLCRVVDQNR